MCSVILCTVFLGIIWGILSLSQNSETVFVISNEMKNLYFDNTWKYLTYDTIVPNYHEHEKSKEIWIKNRIYFFRPVKLFSLSNSFHKDHNNSTFVPHDGQRVQSSVHISVPVPYSVLQWSQWIFACKTKIVDFWCKKICW